RRRAKHSAAFPILLLEEFRSWQRLDGGASGGRLGGCIGEARWRSRVLRRRRSRRGKTPIRRKILPVTLHPGLERRLKAERVGEVHFDAFTRGRYATDASHYQIVPIGVVVPRTIEEAERAIAICRSEGVPVTPRGGGTSQAGQTVNRSIVIDCSRHLNRVVEVDAGGG